MDLNTEFTLCLLKESKEGRQGGREEGREEGRREGERERGRERGREGEREKGILTTSHVFS